MVQTMVADQIKMRFTGCSTNFYEALKALELDDAKRELRRFLTKSEMIALTKRRDRLVELIDSEIEEKGADEVLFNHTNPPIGPVVRYEGE